MEFKAGDIVVDEVAHCLILKVRENDCFFLSYLSMNYGYCSNYHFEDDELLGHSKLIGILYGV